MRRCLLAVAGLLLASPSFGWGAGHAHIRAWAAARLAPWELEALSPVRAKLCRDYLALQDTYAGQPTPELARFCAPPGLRLSLHDINDPEVSAQGFVWYQTQVEQALRANQLDGAVRYLGVMCHWLEDPGSPSAHCLAPMGLNEAQLRDLVPPPPDKEQFAYTYGHHGVNVDGLLRALADRPYTPALLGVTKQEAAFQLVHRQRQIARRARSVVIPSLQDFLYGDGRQAAALVGEQALAVGELVADALHTALSLAVDRVEPAQAAGCDGWPVSRLETLPLGGKADEPYIWVPFVRHRSLDGQRRLQPLRLPGEAKPFAHGFGQGGRGVIQVPMPLAGVYTKLTATVGLHASAGPQGAVRFVVLADSTVLQRSEVARSAQPGLTLAVALPTAKPFTLRLTVEPEAGSKALDNLAVWGEPRLWR